MRYLKHYDCYARLQINEAQRHYDPSDHIIIAHALCNGMPLISDDDKFPFSRESPLKKWLLFGRNYTN